MNSKERLLALFRRQPIDRIPISTYGVDRFTSPWMTEDPTYNRPLAVSDRYEDIFVKYGCIDTDFTELVKIDPSVEMHVDYRREGKSLFRHAEIVTPHRTLRSKARWDDGLHSTWFLEPYLKDIEDIKAFLTLPQGSPVVEHQDFDRVQRDLGDRGLMMWHISDPVGYLGHLLGMQTFLTMTLTDRDLIEGLFQVIWHRVRAALVAYLEAGLGPVFRMIGSEIATPPMLPPKLFERWVVRYDQEIIDLIRQHQCFSRYHCHGRLSQVVAMIVGMHPDLLEPCEAPPGGDMTMTELADATHGEIILMGNIQGRDMENAPAEEIKRQVLGLIQETKGKAPFILSPTSGLYSSPIDPVAQRNFCQFVETGVEYGALNGGV